MEKNRRPTKIKHAGWCLKEVETCSIDSILDRFDLESWFIP